VKDCWEEVKKGGKKNYHPIVTGRNRGLLSTGRGNAEGWYHGRSGGGVGGGKQDRRLIVAKKEDSRGDDLRIAARPKIGAGGL